MIVLFILPILAIMAIFLFSWELFLPEWLLYIILIIDIVWGIIVELKHLKNKHSHKNSDFEDDEW